MALRRPAFDNVTNAMAPSLAQRDAAAACHSIFAPEAFTTVAQRLISELTKLP